jgi:hypothetical protein
MTIRRIEAPRTIFTVPQEVAVVEHEKRYPRGITRHVEEAIGNIDEDLFEPLAPTVQKREEVSFTRPIALVIPGVFFIFLGIYYAMTSKSATDFESFYWNIITSNILTSVGIVILYHGIGETIASVRRKLNKGKKI